MTLNGFLKFLLILAFGFALWWIAEQAFQGDLLIGRAIKDFFL